MHSQVCVIAGAVYNIHLLCMIACGVFKLQTAIWSKNLYVVVRSCVFSAANAFIKHEFTIPTEN